MLKIYHVRSVDTDAREFLVRAESNEDALSVLTERREPSMAQHVKRINRNTGNSLDVTEVTAEVWDATPNKPE